jgi:hypothetical protein
MAKRKNTTLGLLVGVLLILAYVLYSNAHPLGLAVRASADSAFAPLAIENPAVRFELLQQMREFQYQGPRRNIFSVVTAPAPPPKVEEAPPPPPEVKAPPPPPPLVIPATLVGFAADSKMAARRAIFSADDDIYPLVVGDVLLNRFRVVRIWSENAELEEVKSGRRTTLTLAETSNAP